MEVTLADGSTVDACCGPAAARLLSEGAVGYQPRYPSRPGICCHTGGIRRSGLLAIEAEARDTDRVYQAVGAMLGDRR